MRWRMAAWAVLLGSSMVMAAEVNLDGFDGEVMRAMDDAFKDLEPVLGASNVEAAKVDVATLKDGYQWTLEFFEVDRGAPEAAGINKAGQALLAEIDSAIDKGDFPAAVGKARDLQANCKSCHQKYRPKKQ
jgi:cytochrome c556